VESRPLASALRDIREKIGSGTTFADALANHPAYFSDLYVNMVRAGEASGSLDVVLAGLADYIQSQHRLHARVMAALTYPIVMVVIGVGVVSFLLMFVVPKILVVLKSQKAALPLPTEILIAVCAVVTQFWWMFIIAFFGLWVLKRVIVATPKGRLAYDSMLLKMPVLGELFRKQAVSRFASTFAALLESGIPAVEALGIAKSVTGNMVLSNCLDEVRQKIIQGSNIAGPLKKSKVFPPVMGYMVAVGEESGRLEQLLRKVAEAYDEEIEVTTQKVTAMLEPVLIVVMATVVGFIVLSILLPIIEMSKLG
jgi:general secretion pathway protein F